MSRLHRARVSDGPARESPGPPRGAGGDGWGRGGARRIRSRRPPNGPRVGPSAPPEARPYQCSVDQRSKISTCGQNRPGVETDCWSKESANTSQKWSRQLVSAIRPLVNGIDPRPKRRATGQKHPASGPQEAIGCLRRWLKGSPAPRRCAASRQSRQRKHWRPVRCQRDCLRGGGKAAEGGGLEGGRLEDVVGVVRVRLRSR